MNLTRNHIAAMEKQYRTTLINSLPGYKALHMVGTIDSNGITNLALFNSVFHIGANPALLGMVVRPGTDKHDTLNNILSTQQYTLNNVLPEWYMQAHQTSAHFEQGVSEFAACGFNKTYIRGFKPPFVEQSTIKMGIELKETVDITLNGTTIVIGELMHIEIDDLSVGADGYVDHGRAGTVTVIGLDSYFTGSTLGRLAYAKPDKAPQQLSDRSYQPL